MSIHLFIHKKILRACVFSPNKIWKKFLQTNMFTYKMWWKYPTHTFIQDHNVIRATRLFLNWDIFWVLNSSVNPWFSCLQFFNMKTSLSFMVSLISLTVVLVVPPKPAHSCWSLIETGFFYFLIVNFELISDDNWNCFLESD